MNREAIIRMAREAATKDGSTSRADGKTIVLYAAKTNQFLERFAALVAAAERERREFELAECYRCGWDGGVKAERDACARLCGEEKALRMAEMIRAKGEK